MSVKVQWSVSAGMEEWDESSHLQGTDPLMADTAAHMATPPAGTVHASALLLGGTTRAPAECNPSLQPGTAISSGHDRSHVRPRPVPS